MVRHWTRVEHIGILLPEELFGGAVNALYPVMLNVLNRRCMVIGGGKVAERKLLRLLQEGAAVTVVSPQVTETIRDLADHGRLMWIEREYESRDADGAFLVIAATTERRVNRQVWRDASGSGALVNVADDPSLCSIMMPAVVEAGGVTVTISTHGDNPRYSKLLRQALEEDLQSGSDRFVEQLRHNDIAGE